jgi:tetratricopeptide (TPR) repeat protein
MATGRPAFTGTTPMEVLDAVLHATPEPISVVRRDLSAELSQVIGKALGKDPSQRYQHMSELTADLRRVTVPTSRITRSIRTSALAASLVVVATLIWLAAPAVTHSVSVGDTTGSSHRETTSLPAYRAIIEARGLYAGNRWEAALESTQRALDLDPDYAAAWALLGKIYIGGFASPPGYPGGSREDYRSHALTAAKRALDLDPSSYDGQVALALAHREMFQIERSRAVANRAIDLNPQFAEAYAVLGSTYSEATAWGCGYDRDTSRALSYYRRAVSIDAAVREYHIGLSNSLRLAGNLDEALSMAEEGLRIHPTNRGIRRAKAWVLIDLGRVDEAERILREAVADGGPRGNDQMHFAAIDLQRGRLQAAADGFRKTTPAPAQTRRSISIARYYIKAGLPGQALEYLVPIVQAEPACAEYLLKTKSSYWSLIRSNSQARPLLEMYSARAPAP